MSEKINARTIEKSNEEIGSCFHLIKMITGTFVPGTVPSTIF